jgi:hypothetical protein
MGVLLGEVMVFSFGLFDLNKAASSLENWASQLAATAKPGLPVGHR